MIAIQTRYIPATATRPARIKAYTMIKGQALVMALDAASSAKYYRGGTCSYLEDAHRAVAQALADRHGWTGRLIAGETQRGFAFVFADK